VIETEQVPQSYAEAVSTLVRWQAEGGPSDLVVFHFPDSAAQTVRLLEISDEFLADGCVKPFTLGRSASFPFRSTVILASPQEWREIQAGRLSLPEGWDLQAKQQAWP
jgi:hypothetical protein